jgi:rhodanese-related sulfurtransferase
MGFINYFKPVATWSADEVRKFLKDRNPEGYNLVDVRQPVEYEKEHLPGALLIPLGELKMHLEELDPEKPTIAY